jgi:hypothetical protein
MNQSFNEPQAGGPATWIPPASHAGAGVGNEATGESCTAGAVDYGIGGRHDGDDESRRGLLSGVQFPEVVDTFHELEQFVRRNPWPMLAIGFIAGYLLSRSKVR